MSDWPTKQDRNSPTKTRIKCSQHNKQHNTTQHNKTHNKQHNKKHNATQIYIIIVTFTYIYWARPASAKSRFLQYAAFISSFIRKFTLEQAMETQRRNRGIPLLFFTLGTIWEWEVNTTLQPLYPRERNPVSILQEAGWELAPSWTGEENLAPTGNPSPTFQPVSSSQTDWAIGAHTVNFVSDAI
jgi:hypothetical protein